MSPENPYAAPVTGFHTKHPVIDSLTLLLLRVDLFVSSVFTLRAILFVVNYSLVLLTSVGGLETIARLFLMRGMISALLDLTAGLLFLAYDLRALVGKHRSVALLIIAHGVLLVLLGLEYRAIYADFLDSTSDTDHQRMFTAWLPYIARLMYWPVCMMGFRTLQKFWPDASRK
ncbi:MAG: hypothetical protein K8S54_19960 [Spirochaetia bacterium]|nr:hypothetical protein [Spirochaetia bacterium]